MPQNGHADLTLRNFNAVQPPGPNNEITATHCPHHAARLLRQREDT
jgi:hypothetical protein